MRKQQHNEKLGKLIQVTFRSSDINFIRGGRGRQYREGGRAKWPLSKAAAYLPLAASYSGVIEVGDGMAGGDAVGVDFEK